MLFFLYACDDFKRASSRVSVQRRRRAELQLSKQTAARTVVLLAPQAPRLDVLPEALHVRLLRVKVGLCVFEGEGI